MQFILSHSYLSECPLLILKVHADFVWVFPDRSLEDLRHCEVPLLIDIDQDEELEVAPGAPRVPASSVVEQVERVVPPSEEVGAQEQPQHHVTGQQL